LVICLAPALARQAELVAQEIVGDDQDSVRDDGRAA